MFKGLLAALEALEVLNSVPNKKHFGFWAVSLVASNNVVEKLQAFRATEPGTPARDLAMGALLGAMRHDLADGHGPR